MIRCQINRWVFAVCVLPLLHCGRAKFDADCTMDGHGMGRCDVTNSGKAAGAHCFRVRVSNKEGRHPPAVTDVFCLGQVEPKATKRVSFHVADLREVCRGDSGGGEDAGDAPWQKYCDFAIDEALPRIVVDAGSR